MTNPIQLLRDFRKKREEKRKKAKTDYIFNHLNKEKIKDFPTFLDGWYEREYRRGVLFGIEHRKELLKSIKI